MKYYKILGLDFGEKTIGVAISYNGVATGLTTIFRKDAAALRPCLKELKKIIREHEIKKIILGYPKNLNGEDSARCVETLAFKEKILRYIKNTDVVLWDERLSTRAVSRVFDARNPYSQNSKKNFKNNVDKMAAIYILQGFLDHQNGKETLMTDENFDEFTDDDDNLVIIDDDGEELPLQILSSREHEKIIYLLAAEPDTGEVFHFICKPQAEDAGEDDDILMELIDEDDENFDFVLELFKDDYEEFGIELDEE
ncbi:MAG: Holliday junction resolvase RuvX [Defluviitaleaceae bacterium]|nr:Holliday junction resolvase RuvX [Defluviitaleaceae bacterium]